MHAVIKVIITDNVIQLISMEGKCLVTINPASVKQNIIKEMAMPETMFKPGLQK